MIQGYPFLFPYCSQMHFILVITIQQSTQKKTAQNNQMSRKKTLKVQTKPFCLFHKRSLNLLHTNQNPQGKNAKTVIVFKWTICRNWLANNGIFKKLCKICFDLQKAVRFPHRISFYKHRKLLYCLYIAECIECSYTCS